MKQAHKKQLKSIGKILFDKDSYYIENHTGSGKKDQQ